MRCAELLATVHGVVVSITRFKQTGPTVLDRELLPNGQWCARLGLDNYATAEATWSQEPTLFRSPAQALAAIDRAVLAYVREKVKQ